MVARMDHKSESRPPIITDFIKMVEASDAAVHKGNGFQLEIDGVSYIPLYPPCTLPLPQSGTDIVVIEMEGHA